MDAPVGSKAALRRMLGRTILTLRKIVSSLLLILLLVSDLLVRLVVLVLLVVLGDYNLHTLSPFTVMLLSPLRSMTTSTMSPMYVRWKSSRVSVTSTGIYSP